MAVVAVVTLGTFASASAAAPQPGSLEEQCVAAGTVLPREMQGFMFNHHPEKKREPRAGDHFQTVLETVAEFQGVIPRMPDACAGHFRQLMLAKAQFKASKSSGRWRSLGGRWENLPLGVRTLEFIGDPPPSSPFADFRGLQNTNTFGLGCTVDGRVKFKLEVVNEENEAIVAIRYAELPLQVDSWFEARCLGRFSIQESSGAHRCGQITGTKAAHRASLWGVKVKGVGCGEARSIAQRALEVPAFLEGSLLEQPVDGWQCFYGHRGAASCLRRSQHVFLVARAEVAKRCDPPPQGIKRLWVAGTDCAVGEELAASVHRDPGTETVLSREVGGISWTCPASRSLGEGDRMTATYECVADGVAVTFEIVDPKAARVVPVSPTAIPPEVLLPPVGALGFPRTPMFRFGYETTVRGGKLLLPLEVDPALVGRRARLEIKAGTMKCEWTADPSDDAPDCAPTHWLGRSKVQEITLQATQLVPVGLNRHQGNWAYEVRARTKAFSAEGLLYTRAVAGGWAGIVNEAGNCSANPWCHPHRHRSARVAAV